MIGTREERQAALEALYPSWEPQTLFQLLEKKAEKLPERLPSPLAQWAMAHAPEEIPAGFGIDAAVRLTRVMVAAYANA